MVFENSDRNNDNIVLVFARFECAGYCFVVAAVFVCLFVCLFLVEPNLCIILVFMYLLVLG